MTRGAGPRLGRRLLGSFRPSTCWSPGAGGPLSGLLCFLRVRRPALGLGPNASRRNRFQSTGSERGLLGRLWAAGLWTTTEVASGQPGAAGDSRAVAVLLRCLEPRAMGWQRAFCKVGCTSCSPWAVLGKLPSHFIESFLVNYFFFFFLISSHLSCEGRSTGYNV